MDIRFIKTWKGEEPDGYNAVAICPFCGKNSIVHISAEELFRLNQGELVQNALPAMSAEDREILVSGICRDCQREVFAPNEEE